MGIFDTAADIATGAVSAYGTYVNNRENNRFNAQQSKEQRDWEERMSNTSWQRGVKDMRAAGINPMLAFSKGGASTPMGSAASATGGESPVSSALGARRLKLDIDNAVANNEKIKSDVMVNHAIANATNWSAENTKVQSQLGRTELINALRDAEARSGKLGTAAAYSKIIGEIASDIMGVATPFVSPTGRGMAFAYRVLKGRQQASQGFNWNNM